MENLQIDKSGDRLSFRFAGEITMDITQELKSEIIGTMESDEFSQITLDMSEVSFIDSSGIGFLVALNSRCRSEEKAFILHNPSSQVRKTLELVQLIKYFNISAE